MRTVPRLTRLAALGTACAMLGAFTPTAANAREVTAAAGTRPATTYSFGLEDCPRAHVCIFEHVGGQGRMGATFRNKKDLSDSRAWSGYMNDKVTDIQLNRAEPWCFYYDANYRGAHFIAWPNQPTHLAGKTENDQISSFREARYVKRWPWSRPQWKC